MASESYQALRLTADCCHLACFAALTRQVLVERAGYSVKHIMHSPVHVCIHLRLHQRHSVCVGFGAPVVQALRNVRLQSAAHHLRTWHVVWPGNAWTVLP